MSSQANSETPFDCAGSTTEGNKFTNISSMWAEELPTQQKSTWYKKSEDYWDTQSASVKGMLGGLDSLHTRDIAASKRFLKMLNPTRRRVLDVGAGIGRVTRTLLGPLFEQVDMLEQSAAYVAESRSYLSQVPNVGDRFVCGMQEFRSAGFQARDGAVWAALDGVYDVVWVQWCVIYLTDEHFVKFFEECGKCLVEGGLICVKDNVAKKGFLVDKEDSSVMRSDAYMKHLFGRAGLKVVKTTRQMDFPSRIFPVRTYALRPVITEDEKALTPETETAHE